MTNVKLEQLFHEARTHNAWQAKPVSDEMLHQIWDLLKWAPTSANCEPLRIVFVRQGAEREKLLTAMSPGNVDKTRAAPMTAILARDVQFYEKLPKLFPHTDARSWFVGNEALIEKTAQQNANLQIGYFILAARAVGLDCGPMAGFDGAKVDEAFFKGTSWRANLVCNLGYGDPKGLFPRSPRLDFEEACKIIG